MAKEAYLYETLDNRNVRCLLCHHSCVIAEGKRGRCQVRENQGGRLISLVYEKLISANVDPIEKKPLFHFLPGSRSFSVATVGCNFRCLHCQNHEISQMPRDQTRIFGESVPPETLVSEAVRHGCATIAYTYTEPTIYFEYAYDTAKLAKEQTIRNIFVTNGYMSSESLEMSAPYLDGANVDLKSFSEEFYREVCGATLEPVLDNIRIMKQHGTWVEVTTLVIPTLNDSEDELRRIARFVYSVSPDIPWHVSAFYPTYKMLDKPRTSPEILRQARSLGIQEGLRYVYTGNLPGDDGEHTYCYNCQGLVIRRHGYRITENRLNDSRCPICNTTVDGVWA